MSIGHGHAACNVPAQELGTERSRTRSPKCHEAGFPAVPNMLLALAGLLCGHVLPRAGAPRMQLAIEKVELPKHEHYLAEVAMIMAPTALTSVVGVLVSRGEEVVEPGWGLIDPQTREIINPYDLVTNEHILMTDWEIQDFAVQVVRNYLTDKLNLKILKAKI